MTKRHEETGETFGNIYLLGQLRDSRDQTFISAGLNMPKRMHVNSKTTAVKAITRMSMGTLATERKCSGNSSKRRRQATREP